MSTPAHLYKRHRFPPEVIQHAVWLYYRFNLSHRDVEEMLAQRRLKVSRESIRLCCNKVRADVRAAIAASHRGYGDTLFVDEVFVKIRRKMHYLWRAVVRTSKSSTLGAQR